MVCGCSNNKKSYNNRQLDDDKKLTLESMERLSIDEIINLYKDGYRLEKLEENQHGETYSNIREQNANIREQSANTKSSSPNIASMSNPSFSYIEATRRTAGGMTFIALVNNSGSRGRIRLKAFNRSTGTCIEDTAMQTDQCIEASFNTYISIGLLQLVYAMKTSGTQFDPGCLRAYTCSSGDTCSSCTTFSTSPYASNDNVSVGYAADVTPNAITGYTLTPGNGTIVANWTDPNNTSIFAYLVALTRVSDSVELARGYIRGNSVTISNLTNGTQYSFRIVPISYDFYTGSGITLTATPVAPMPSVADVFNTCWSTALGTTCSIPPERLAVPTGTSITLKADMANSGTTGKIRAVFKINGVAISDQNIASLATYTIGGALWSPTVSYTMSGADVTFAVDGYGWSGTTWTLTDTMSATISRSTPTCTGISVDANVLTANIGDTITLTAYGITPTTQPYTVTFTDRTSTLGTCTSSNGMCSISWNTTGKSAGTYYVKAAVTGQCTSSELAIGLSLPVQQWTLGITVQDVNTSIGISGASVMVSAYGPPTGTQTLSTNASGFVQFLVTQGTIDVTISKTGYNTRTIPDSLYNNRTTTYYLTPTTPTPGSLKFITVPSSAQVFFGATLKGTTDATTGILQIDNLPAGQVTSYTVKKTGYNDSSGSATVQSATVLDVPITLTVVTPTTGDICMKSNPFGASIKIDNINQAGKTTAASGGGCTSSNIIYGLTPVSHSYELSLTGYQNKTGAFTPTAGTTIDVDAGILTPSPTVGNVTFTSTPPGARIYIDNVDTQFATNATITSITQGSHSYKLTLTGYIDATGTFSITAGQTTTVPNVVLIQRLGNLKFFSNPVGAEILIEGTSKGVTTASGLIVSDLPIGSTDFIARLINYDDYIGNVIVEEGITKNVTATFTPMLTTIVISPTDPSLIVGHTQQLMATGKDQSNNNITIAPAPTWESSDPLVASINPTTGILSALLPGTTTVTATSGIISGNTTVTVHPQGTLICQSITLVANPSTITEGNSTTLYATVVPSSETLQEFSVQFIDGQNPIDTPVQTSGHAATKTWTPSTIGTHNITAKVGTECTSPQRQVVVNPVGTTGEGGGIVFALAGVAALGMMMSAKKPPSSGEPERKPKLSSFTIKQY